MLIGIGLFTTYLLFKFFQLILFKTISITQKILWMGFAILDIIVLVCIYYIFNDLDLFIRRSYRPYDLLMIAIIISLFIVIFFYFRGKGLFLKKKGFAIYENFCIYEIGIFFLSQQL